jgi:coenzyme PQQ synthesis protein D (PqqD)
MYRQRDSISVERIEEDLCLYLAETNDVAVLNRTAAAIWEAVGGGGCVEEIANELAAAYDKPADEVVGEVRRTLEELASRGFLVRV